MSSAGKRDANSSATALFPDAVGPKIASTKTSTMPRFWCLASRFVADIRRVKLLPSRFGDHNYLDGRAHELAAFIVLGAALSAAALVGVSWAAGFGAVAD